MKKKILALSIALVMVFALAACGSGGGGEALTFVTGSDTGTYYAFGQALGGYINENSDVVNIKTVVGNGSQQNVEDMHAGEAQLGFVQSDVMSYAYNGTRLFVDDEGNPAPVTDFRTLAALYMEQLQIVTLDPNIKTVADLEGKTVSIGATGSGVYFNALDVLGVYGLDHETDINAVYQDFGTSADSLQDGTIDAAFIVAGAPTSAISNLAASQDVYLVSLDQEHIDALIEQSPYYSANTIAASVYGTPEDVTTVAVNAVLIAREDISDDAAYAIVSNIFKGKGSIGHDKENELDLTFASSVTDVPYHPGAARYFEEQGITVPTE